MTCDEFKTTIDRMQGIGTRGGPVAVFKETTAAERNACVNHMMTCPACRQRTESEVEEGLEKMTPEERVVLHNLSAVCSVADTIKIENDPELRKATYEAAERGRTRDL